MALLVSNTPDILVDLNIILGCKYTKVGSFNISVRNDLHHVHSIGNFSPMGVFSGPPDVDLDLKIYIDQMATLSKEDIFSQLEERIGEFLHIVEGVFLQRSVHPYRDKTAMTVNYTLKLRDYDTFVSKLNYLARSKSDREFIKVLEEKLSES